MAFKGRVCAVVLSLATSLAAAAQIAAKVRAQDREALFQNGQALASKGRLAEAEVVLTEAAASAPAREEVLTLLGEVKSRLGEPDQAVGLFRQVVVLRPKWAQAHLNLAIALADTANARNALPELESAIRLDPKDPRPHLNRARLLAGLGRPVEARPEFVRARQLAPEDPAILYFWGAFEKDNHRPAAAVSLLAGAVRQQPDNLRALTLLAQSQELLGQREAAIISWRKAVAVDPRSQEAVYALSQALRKSDPQESARLARQFTVLHDEAQRVEQVRELGNEAYAAMQHEDWVSAIQTLSRALDLCAGCGLEADLHQRLGLAECHRGDLGDGERELRFALRLDPNNRETLQALEWINQQKDKR